VFDDVVDRVARGIDVVAHLLDHVVDGNAIDQLLTALHGGSEAPLRTRCHPSRAFRGAVSRPARALETALTGPLRSTHSCHSRERSAAAGVANQWTNRATTRGSASQ